MVMLQVSVMFAAVLLLFGIQTGTALYCYECNSHNDSNCANDKPPENFKKDCSEHQEGSKYILCRKTVQYIDFEVNGNMPEKRVIRACGWDDSSYKNRCYQRSGFGGRQEVCSCDSDNCNAAHSLTFYSSTVGLLMALITIQRLLF